MKLTQNVTFTVEDNGIGIPLEKMDNLFKTFYQVDTTLARKHGGTGLGLVICKGIIERSWWEDLDRQKLHSWHIYQVHSSYCG